MSTMTLDREHTPRRASRRPLSAESEERSGFSFGYGSDGLEKSLVPGGVLVEAEMPQEVEPSAVDVALSFYSVRKTSSALDAFAHPLMDQLVKGDLRAADSLVGIIADRIDATIAQRGSDVLTRDFAELEMWLAAVTLTTRVAGELSSRPRLVESLRVALEMSNHEDKRGLLRAIY
jgi:orotate phosphoribosyltransferase-like protein